ncbi:MAG: ABC transporter permease [Phycisphaerales bacterium]|nr:ABC transporter permease [Phycisphaerales bacterium]
MIGTRATLALAKRELIRQTRQPSRIIASIATPLLIWLFIVGGFSNSIGSVAQSNSTIGAYTIPGMASLTVMFASIFASISLIQDRQDGVLRAALVSPAPRWSIAMSKISAGSVLALLQALIVLLTLPFLGVTLTPIAILGAIAALACISIALIGLGLALAWMVDSTQGFHGVMNAILMPMWLTSGAVFPVENSAGWLKVIALINPLTWTHTAMRSSLGMDTGFSTSLAWIISIAFAVFGIGLASLVISRPSKGKA